MRSPIILCCAIARMTSISELLKAIAILGLLADSCFCQNFTCRDESLRQVAEKARIDSATFWQGSAMKRWSSPCPITVIVNSRASEGGGYSKFTFAGGHVYNWSMVVEAAHRDQFTYAVRHEVDHTVRASLVRRPIARWVDEGCASLFESEVLHERYRREALASRNSRSSVWRWLDSINYPDNPREFYVTSFVAVEYLLREHGKASVLEFQRDTRRPSVKFEEHFGRTPKQAEVEWNHYVMQFPQIGFR